MWSEVNKRHNRWERVSELLADTGKERHRRDDDYSSRVEGALEYHAAKAAKKGIGRGGSTPVPTRLSRTEKRAADKILKEGKQPRGNK